MTTINNSENLIEKVGGIERAIALEAMLQKHAVPESWKISIINGMWHRSSVGFTHSDLRTAIAEYSPDSYEWVGVHYKLGDYIVYKRPWVGNNLVLKIGGAGNQSMSLASASMRQNYIRHATPEEIKAGHRLEAERHG